MNRFTLLFLSALIIGIAGCHSPQHTLFKKISSSSSGIHFTNEVVEDDSINPLDMEFLYNGGGVAVGDFNNDGLPDLYFTASEKKNRLYLNLGKLSFKDVTEEAGVDGAGEWANAASVVDINHDGLEDIYVCNSIYKDPGRRRNLLYINQGLDANKVPVFKEMAAAYGLADTSLSVHAAFFDYDNDGDLDMYLVTTKLARRDASRFGKNTADSAGIDIDKLFRNDWDSALGHPVFTDVSRQAGIVDKGFGLGVTIADINRDGWKDIYVTNDFLSSDALYINNRNGTFTNKVNQYFKHTSQNAMGNDIADLNNDGLADVIAVDMNPEGNFRKKKNMGGSNYFMYQNMLYQNITLQYVRNTVQLNLGPSMKANDSTGDPVFADIGYFTGMAETDWSWTPSIADFDNDGWRDVIITNGYPKDVTDHDFAAYRNEYGNLASKKQILEQIPQIKISNYGFRNKGSLHFENVTTAWGLDDPGFSSGAVYVDLDNDGDLDYVINNINDEASVYENTTNSIDHVSKNFLEISFAGPFQNPRGLGAWAEIYYDHGKMQTFENNPYRGYLSTLDTRAFFGLDSTAFLDSVIIRWPTGYKQKLDHINANQMLQVSFSEAKTPDSWTAPVLDTSAIFTDVTKSLGINYSEVESDYIDFNTERLLPHKLSQYGPGLATGDVDENGLDDIFIGGSGDYPAKFLLQQPDGKFKEKNLLLPNWPNLRRPENLGVLLFDADGDGDPDLYCANGSNQFAPNTPNYQDELFVNDGKGNFSLDTAALPRNFTSKSCVKACDIDGDGDLDLFVGGRVLPRQYPRPVSSFIFRNDSKPGHPKFTDVTDELAPGLKNLGMVCDAIWTDFDNDGDRDLIVVGEWMPVQFFRNDNGHFVNISAGSGIGDETGWWNSIAAGDFDNDGDIDYVIGNLGTNSFYKASHEFPAEIYAKDFDKNGSFDAIPVLYLKDGDGKPREFTAQNRDDIVEQLPYLKKRFLTYKEFGTADIHTLFTPGELKGAMVLKASNFHSSYLENIGGGRFRIHPLPDMAQLAPLYGMVVDDVNGDGNLDLLINGNDFGTEVSTGRYDALDGLLLLGDGHGGFKPASIRESGLFIPGDGKALVSLKGKDGKYLLAASENRGPLRVFEEKGIEQIPVLPGEEYAMILLKDGRKRKQEFYMGSSFLSQSRSYLSRNKSVRSVAIRKKNGEVRQIGD